MLWRMTALICITLPQMGMTRVIRCMQRGIQIQLGKVWVAKPDPCAFKRVCFSALKQQPHLLQSHSSLRPSFLLVPIVVSHQRTEVSLWKPPLFFLPVMCGDRDHTNFSGKICPKGMHLFNDPFGCTGAYFNAGKELFIPHMLQKIEVQ